MFAVHQDSNTNGNAIEAPSFHFESAEELLDDPLMTSHADPKFHVNPSKPDNTSFGLFDNLPIYDQYNESEPSSVHFGDINDASDKGGSHMSAGDHMEMAMSGGDGWHAPATGGNHASTTPSAAEGAAGNHLNQTQNDQSTMDITMDQANSPIQESLLDTSDAAAQESSDTIQIASHWGNNTTPASKSKSTHNGVKFAPSSAISEHIKVEHGSASHQHPETSPRTSTATGFRVRTSIPMELSWEEFARQCTLAAVSSRLNPFALHPSEYRLLREHITLAQVTVYLNIRNAILRLWTRNPLVGVTKDEAAGCARDSRYFPLSQVAYEWLVRNGYINFGCVELGDTAGHIPRAKAKSGKGKTIVVIGAGVAGLGSARQLQGLIAQLGHKWTEAGEKPPRVIVLEGRNRIGGRVYSHPLKKQAVGVLPPGRRSTVEMGAHIVTGFEHGNPLNILVRGQLGLHYHTLKDVINTPLYDYDGKVVEKKRDLMVEQLYNDILERASVFRNRPVQSRTIEGDKTLIEMGRDPTDDDERVVSSLEEADSSVSVTNPQQPPSKSGNRDHAPVSVEKLPGRTYQTGTSSSKTAAAAAAQKMGWTLQPGVSPQASLDLTPSLQASDYPTLGSAMDEGMAQYQKMLGLTAQDLRLYNWHHANLEYANAANVNSLSLAGWDQDMGNEFEGEHTQIIGGYIQVPRGLSQCPSPLDVRFHKKITSIRYNGTYMNQDTKTTIHCEDGEVVEADRVVITTPLGVLKSGTVKFEPALPEWKQGCIDRLGFGLLNKVALVFEKSFWEESRDILGLLNDSEVAQSLNQADYIHTRGRFYLFWNCVKTSGRPTLIALMAGDAAYEAELLSNDILIKEATTRLQKMFPASNVPQPCEAIVTRWKHDPYARGSYSYVGPLSQPGDYDAMARPVGHLHFAGEATCGTHPATVHGAYLSGLRAASDVLESMVGPITIPSPLVPAKSKHEESAHSGQGSKKRKHYVEYELVPINPPPPAPEPVSEDKAALEQYEASIIGAILGQIGERPVKPVKQGVNPFLLYQKEHWYTCKAEADAEKQKTHPNAKASREEVRIHLGHKWRNLPEDVKKPYLDQAQGARDETGEKTADYKERVRKWDEDAERIREEFVKTNNPPGGWEGRKGGRTAIELGLGGKRKGRKISYAEEGGEAGEE
ncbi:hypothetical protein K402DRAFT_394115 [Aulographum hederae CBS 113979]|uniref:SWIRM domain-containing protein n=1 Tax=Aulographum hederae CBS 113979 TaxID=1176131 RepID=A0A6G1GZN6_9PEZI|nr:hypothetical protein K402DRAFT_394115 [Aulographum hederae CBS 113979]